LNILLQDQAVGIKGENESQLEDELETEPLAASSSFKPTDWQNIEHQFETKARDFFV